MERLLTITQVAELLQVHPRTVRRYLAKGALRSVRISGRLVRIRQDDLEAFLNNATQTTELDGKA